MDVCVPVWDAVCDGVDVTDGVLVDDCEMLIVEEVVGSGVPPMDAVIDAVFDGVLVWDDVWEGEPVCEAVDEAVFDEVVVIDAVPDFVCDGVAVAVAVTVGIQYVFVRAGDKPRITVFAPAVTISVDVAVTVLYM